VEERVEDPAGGRGPAEALMARVRLGDFARWDELAAGRFLQDFHHNAAQLDAIDIRDLRPLRRGPSLCEVGASFLDPEAEGHVRLRFVKLGAEWKLEHVEARPAPLDP
jgi:hypothetical protein